MTTETLYVGVDVSKQWLDVALHKQKLPRRANTPAGLRQLLKDLGRLQQPVHIIAEPTGGYQRALARALWGAHLPISLVNPRQVRDFARAGGRLAKTDAIDAAVMAHYGAAMQPEPTQAPDPAIEELRELEDTRSNLMEMIQMEKNRLEHLISAPSIKIAKGVLKHLQGKLEQTEALITAHIERHAPLKAKLERMCQIKGVGPATACALLAYLPELGTLGSKQICALAGVAPINHDSGNQRGLRHMSGGRPQARKAIYMAALVASQHNRLMRELYTRLVDAGKAPKVALGTVMRRLIKVLNKLLADPDFQLTE